MGVGRIRDQGPGSAAQYPTSPATGDTARARHPRARRADAGKRRHREGRDTPGERTTTVRPSVRPSGTGAPGPSLQGAGRPGIIDPVRLQHSTVDSGQPRGRTASRVPIFPCGRSRHLILPCPDPSSPRFSPWPWACRSRAPSTPSCPRTVRGAPAHRSREWPTSRSPPPRSGIRTAAGSRTAMRGASSPPAIGFHLQLPLPDRWNGPLPQVG